MKQQMDSQPASRSVRRVNEQGESSLGDKKSDRRVSHTRMLRSTAVLISLAIPVGLVAAPVSAQAQINRSDFLKTKQVKTILHGSGKWASLFGHQPVAVPTTPSRCRVDKPLRRSTEKRRRTYFDVDSESSGETSESAVAYTYVYRYRKQKLAKRDLRRLTRQTRKCPRLVEDPQHGEYTTVVRRKLVQTSSVGQQSTAWRLREVIAHGNLRWRSRGYVVAARHGRTIVVTTATHGHEMPGSRPTPPTKKSVIKLAKAALLKAR